MCRWNARYVKSWRRKAEVGSPVGRSTARVAGTLVVPRSPGDVRQGWAHSSSLISSLDGGPSALAGRLVVVQSWRRRQGWARSSSPDRLLKPLDGGLTANGLVNITRQALSPAGSARARIACSTSLYAACALTQLARLCPTHARADSSGVSLQTLQRQVVSDAADPRMRDIAVLRLHARACLRLGAIRIESCSRSH
jgi:hypothetical protein